MQHKTDVGEQVAKRALRRADNADLRHPLRPYGNEDKIVYYCTGSVWVRMISIIFN